MQYFYTVAVDCKAQNHNAFPVCNRRQQFSSIETKTRYLEFQFNKLNYYIMPVI